jgi:hypothetical protein
MLDEAGVEPPTTWDEVRDVAAALTGDGVYGIAFSAVATEEGSWQFEPWFWGAGADLTQLDSPEAVQALEFWVDLVESGYASRSVVTWSQGDVNDQFIAGNAAMMQNGVWNLPTLDESGINYNVVPIPMPEGGAAPGPMGGEVLALPLSGDDLAPGGSRAGSGGQPDDAILCRRGSSGTCSYGSARQPGSQLQLSLSALVECHSGSTDGCEDAAAGADRCPTTG